MKLNFFLIGCLLLISQFTVAQSSQIVLKTNFKGEVSYGSIDSLISKIKEGKAVRVGWQLDFDDDGVSDLEHWIDADFISILNGHVFNQISPIYRQIPNEEIPQIQIVSSTMQWTGIIGTNGKLINRYIMPDLDLQMIEDEKVQARMQKIVELKEWMVATIWAIKD